MAWAYFAIALSISIWPQTGKNAAGQAANPPDSAKTAESSARLAGLDPNPLEIDALGLKVNLPDGAGFVMEKVDGQTVLSVSDDPATPTWTIRIQPLQTTQQGSTAASQIQALLNEFSINKQQIQVLTNSAFTAQNATGQLCFIQQKLRDQGEFVSGWLLLPTGESTFLVFSVQTLPEHLPRIRPLLEASFATISVRSVSDIAAERAARLAAGQTFLESVTPALLKAQVGLNQWYRYYKPAENIQTPETEIGYALMEVLEAKKGALDPSQKESDYDSGENKPGIMLRIQGRIVVNAERGRYYDSIALYWMAWDQSEEAWTVRGSDRQGQVEHSEAETGVRMPYMPGSLPPTLTVIKSDSVTNARDPFEWEVPSVYLSQPIGLLLGRLLPKDAKTVQEYRYYSYNFTNRSAQLSQRSDLWLPATDGSGNFQLISRITSDSPPMTSTYNAKGDLIRRIHPDGSLAEPSTVQHIHQLWKAKGLNIGKAQR